MKKFYLQVWLILLTCLLTISLVNAQICDPTKELFVADAQSNVGGTSKISSNNFQLSVTIGNTFIGSVRNPNTQTGSKSVELGFWSFMLREPNTPIVYASDGDFPDRIEVRWESLRDPIGPPVTEQKLYRDGQFLGVFPPTQNAYLDFNVMPGQTYRYEVVTINRFGNSPMGTDVGFVNPNGIITGTIQTGSAVPVPDVEVVLTPTISYSVQFNGVSDKIVLTDSAVNNIRKGSIEFWVYPTKLTQSTIFSKRRVIAEPGHPLGLYSVLSLGTYPDNNGNPVDSTPGKIFFSPRTGGPLASSKWNLSANTWSHVAIIFDSAKAQIFINGLFDNEIVGNFSIPDDRSPRDARPVRTFAGYWEGVGNYFQGYLDEFRWWKSTRSNQKLIENKDRTVDADDTDLLIYWKFDEGKGTRAYDLSPSKNHGLFCGPMVFSNTRKAAVYTSGITNVNGNYIIKGVNYGTGTTFSATPRKLTILGRSLEMDGVDDEIVVQSVVGDTAMNAGTIEAWVYAKSVTGTQPIIALRNDGANSSGILSIKNGKFQFQAKGGAIATDATQLDTALWYHIAVKFNNSAVTFYLNGELGSTVNGDYTIDTGRTTTVATIGSFGSSHFYGRIDEVRVWNTERTQQQIQANMNAPFTTQQNGMQAYWKLNEGGGFIVADETPNFYGGNILNADSTIWTTLIPMNETFAHIFLPETRDVTLAPSSTVVSRIDYTDISLLPVVGFVKHLNTNCFADSVEVLVDGLPARPPAFTGIDGKFKVEFEPGSTHKISFRKNDFQFVPATWDIRNISQPIVISRAFENTVTRSMRISVVGGKCEYSLGKAKVKLTSTNGCFETIVYTDSLSGRVTASSLPPQNYNVSVMSIDNNPVHPFVDDARQSQMKAGNDTITFLYRAPLQVAVKSGFPEPSKCGDIVMAQGDRVKITLELFEDYNGRKCPVDTGTVTKNDYISQILNKKFSFKNGVALDTIVAMGPNPLPPHTWGVEYVAVDTLGSGRTASTSHNVIVTGHRPRPQRFTTINPLRPLMILHDPPGDRSFSSFMKDSTYSTKQSDSKLHAHGGGVEANLQLGVSVTNIIGLGAAVSFESGFKHTISIGADFNYTYLNTHEAVRSVTFNSTYSTSPEDAFVGEGGDVYVGYASNMNYGVSDIVKYDTASCNVLLSKALSMNESNATTMYLYSESYLQGTIIPQLDSFSVNPTLTDSARNFYKDQAGRWRQWVTLNQQQKNAANNPNNISWDAGAIIDNSVTTSTEETWDWSEEWQVDASVGLELGFEFNKAGLTTKFSQHNTASGSFGGGEVKATAKTYSYHLEDDDPGDVHSVDIYEPRGGSPIFKIVGGATSCPWEPGTSPREGVQVGITPTTAINVSPTDPAVFQLNLGNTSPTDEDGTYRVFINQASNPDGAIIKINGVTVETELLIDIPHGTQIPVTLTVERGPVAYNYDNLEVILASTCDDQISATAVFSVHFEVPCSEITLVEPTNNWLINSSDPDSVYITINHYDRNNPDLDEIWLQYRAVASSSAASVQSPNQVSNRIIPDVSVALLPRMEVDDYRTHATEFAGKEGRKNVMDNPWITAIRIPKDSLPTSQNFYQFIWKVPSDVVPDGNYEIRAITTCFAQTIKGSSVIIKGRIDRTPPMLLGSTEPVDGVLGPDDQIIARFNETIDCQALHPLLNVHLFNSGTGLEIDKTITCNGQTVVITPSVPNRFLENQVLRLSFTDDGSAPAYGVRDQYGNRITHSLDYEFYVDRNNMRWDNPTYQVTAMQGQTLTFTRRIFNTGTFSQSFTIAGLPTWLSASPINAIIPAGFSQDVTFTISPQLTGGFYKDTVFASTAGGEEDIILDFRLLCATPAWAVNPSSYEYTMSIDAALRVDGQKSNDMYDMVIAFVGDEVRGIGNVVYVPSAHDTNKYQVFLTVHSNTTRGEQLKFKVWDASTCRELGNILETYSFVADTVYGRPDRPATFTASSQVVQQIALSTGWTWFSLNLRGDNMNVNTLMSKVAPQSNDIIKGQAAFSQYASGLGWVGTLSTLNNKSMYQMKLASRDTLEMTGYAVELATNKIPIVQGWNWISYQPQSGYEVNYALSNLNSLNGDLIKNQSAYAIYVANLGWVGSLNFLSPRVGYLLKSAAADTLEYPAPPAALKSGEQEIETPMSNLPIAYNGWSVNPAQYQYSMAITGAVHQDRENVSDSMDIVAAFVGNECRGLAQAIRVPGIEKYRFFMLAHSNVQEGEELEFKFLDASTATGYMLEEKVTFKQDGIAGDVMAPFSWKTSFRLGTGGEMEAPKQFGLSQNYPNPFNPSTTISYSVPVESEVKISIYDVLGQRVATLVDQSQRSGYYNVVWNGVNDDGHAVTSGIYFYKMTAGGFTSTRKLMLVK